MTFTLPTTSQFPTNQFPTTQVPTDQAPMSQVPINGFPIGQYPSSPYPINPVPPAPTSNVTQRGIGAVIAAALVVGGGYYWYSNHHHPKPSPTTATSGTQGSGTQTGGSSSTQGSGTTSGTGAASSGAQTAGASFSSDFAAFSALIGTAPGASDAWQSAVCANVTPGSAIAAEVSCTEPDNSKISVVEARSSSDVTSLVNQAQADGYDIEHWTNGGTPAGEVLSGNNPATVIVTFDDHPNFVVVLSGATTDVLLNTFGKAPLPA